MSFDHLSDELVIEIAKQHVALVSGENRSLRHLALCSRRLNNIVSSLLYRKFTQEWHKLAGFPNLLRRNEVFSFSYPFSSPDPDPGRGLLPALLSFERSIILIYSSGDGTASDSRPDQRIGAQRIS